MKQINTKPVSCPAYFLVVSGQMFDGGFKASGLLRVLGNASLHLLVDAAGPPSPGWRAHTSEVRSSVPALSPHELGVETGPSGTLSSAAASLAPEAVAFPTLTRPEGGGRVCPGLRDALAEAPRPAGRCPSTLEESCDGGSLRSKPDFLATSSPAF